MRDAQGNWHHDQPKLQPEIYRKPMVWQLSIHPHGKTSDPEKQKKTTLIHFQH
jgi:hypothetical protein